MSDGNIHYGEALRDLVKQHGTQEEIAAKLGISQSTLSTYFRSETSNIDTISKVCKVCGVKTWHFLASLENGIPVDMLKVMELIFKLKQEDRAYVLQQMNTSIDYIHAKWAGEKGINN